MSIFVRSENIPIGKSVKPWKILLVDDEEDVHHITRIALRRISFEGRPVKLISAYSGEEAKEILRQEPDISVAIIDVVMESDDAGLKLVRYIREELKNRYIRLIIRTGQPGYAPRREVVSKYDINDYREKGEISSDVLFTVVISALRSYRDIMRVEKEAISLRQIAHFISQVASERDLYSFVDKVFHRAVEIMKMFGVPFSAVYMVGEDVIYEKGNSSDVSSLKKVWALKGDFQLLWASKDTVLLRLRDDLSVGFAIKLHKVDDVAVNLLNILLHNTVTHAHNVELTKELNLTLFEIIYLLADLLGKRSGETGEHVARVAEIVAALSGLWGLSDDTILVYKLASMLHDIGKIGIPDQILNKPGRLTDGEFEIMNRHTIIGYEMLSRFDKEVFKVAASIARYHHENYDGSGYPDGLSGDAIPLAARITAIADVYDALINDRVYRKAWPEEKVLSFLEEQKGKKFDPTLVELFINNYEEIKRQITRVNL